MRVGGSRIGGVRLVSGSLKCGHGAGRGAGGKGGEVVDLVELAEVAEAGGQIEIEHPGAAVPVLDGCA